MFRLCERWQDRAQHRTRRAAPNPTGEGSTSETKRPPHTTWLGRCSVIASEEPSFRDTVAERHDVVFLDERLCRRAGSAGELALQASWLCRRAVSSYRARSRRRESARPVGARRRFARGARRASRPAGHVEGVMLFHEAVVRVDEDARGHLRGVETPGRTLERDRPRRVRHVEGVAVCSPQDSPIVRREPASSISVKGVPSVMRPSMARPRLGPTSRRDRGARATAKAQASSRRR